MNIHNVSIDDLLLHKNISPLEKANKLALKRIQGLDVRNFTEADVREEIINQILIILGYRKGNNASIDREKHIRFFSKNRFIDYNLTLWEKNFWLIEAKRPHFSEDGFAYEDLRQAFEYASHPEINAALVMLCDGISIEVYDREENVTKPILQIQISNLVNNFDSLRILLEPINVWFFYRRRVIQAIDRAFHGEFNQSRIEEFKTIISRKLDEKHANAFENLRKLKLHEKNEYADRLKSASIDEIIDIHFFWNHSQQDLMVIFDNLKSERKKDTFTVIYKIFPDQVRDANDCFYMNALYFLIELEKKYSSIAWLPSWLENSNSENNVQNAIKRLIELCLTYFEKNNERKLVLLFFNTYKRILKLMSMVSPEMSKQAELQHLWTRFNHPELSTQQIFSSKNRNLINSWEQGAKIFTLDFVQRHTIKNNGFNQILAQQELINLWHTECELLKAIPSFRELERAHNFGEIFPVEYSAVAYDFLGHGALCAIKNSPQWRDYVLQNHSPEVQTLLRLHSWAAREMLGFEITQDVGENITDAELADRFFYGNLNILQQLKIGYGSQ